MTIRPFTLAVLLVLAAPAWVLGCTCNIRPPSCFEYWSTDAVFIGTVSKVFPSESTPLDSVEVAVNENFRGMSSPIARTYNYGHSCAHTFEPGEKYLFYGDVHEKKLDEFGTSYCARTIRLDEGWANTDLEFLRAVRDNRPVFWAWGTVSTFYDQPLAGIRAEVLGQTRKIEGTSNVEGDIKLELSKPGTYRIRIYLPKGRTDINAIVRNDSKLWEMQRKQIVGGRFRGSRPYVDYQVVVGPSRCGWFDVSIPND